MTDYRKVCWSCGKADMENKGDFSQCRSCGATWNEIPSIGEWRSEGDHVVLRTDKGRKIMTARSPSARSKRETALNRGDSPPAKTPKRAARHSKVRF